MRDGLINSTSPNCTASYPSVVGVFRCTTMQGPAFNSVTGTACPSGRNTCDIPIFLPRIPGLINKRSQKPEARSQKDRLRPLLLLSTPFHASPTSALTPNALHSGFWLLGFWLLPYLPNALISTSTPAGRSS